MECFNLKPDTFGLDVSDLSLKIASLKKKGKLLNLSSWGETKIKPGIIEDGEIKDSKVLSQSIRKAVDSVKGEKIKTKKVIVSLPEKKAFLQVIKMPKMAKSQLKTAVPFEAENYVPLPLESVYLDFQVIPSNNGYSKKHLDILIAAIPKTVVDPYVSCLKDAGFNPHAFEIESQSISRALVKNNVSPFPVLMIDFGKSRTSLIIFSGYSLQFTSSITISSHNLTESISRFMKIELEKAEKLKTEYGLLRFLEKKQKRSKSLGNRCNKVFDAMVPVLTDLTEQIKKYLSYYQTHSGENGKKEVQKVLLCGRGANLRGLSDYLSSELKIPVELGNPWVNILPEPIKKVPGLSFRDSLGYTSALGLALRNV